VRVLLAPDSFGGTLSAAEAARALADGWQAAAPGDDLDLLPLSDGGPGLVGVLASALPGSRLVEVQVEDPLARTVPARLLVDGTVAYVESAAAAGLHLLEPGERAPLRTTTYGVGQLLRAALDQGATRLVVGLGGSATNDGGAGMLAALGLGRHDAAGERLPSGAEPLLRIAGLQGTLDPRLSGVELVAATDVDAPLLGPGGASAVFGPQKGAAPDDVPVLDAALTRWAEVLEAHLGVSVRDLPGAGAAGGLGAALLAVGARREPGIALVRRLVRLDERVGGADLVVTGEGCLDGTSLMGKAVAGVAQACAEHAVPCLVVAGEVRVGRREAGAAGIEATYALVDAVGPERALTDAAASLREVAGRVAREWSRG
jgi:glycerate kinase